MAKLVAITGCKRTFPWRHHGVNRKKPENPIGLSPRRAAPANPLPQRELVNRVPCHP